MFKMATKSRFRLALLSAMLCFSCMAHAAPAQSLAADPVLEKRMLRLTEELRCLVCQNQTLADSHADLAIDLKNQVREKLASGMSEQEVIDYMVQRYGDFVLYRPRLFGATWILWFGPLLLLLGGLGALILKLSRRRAEVVPDMSEQDRARAAAMLYSDESEPKANP